MSKTARVKVEKPETLYNWHNAPSWAVWAEVEGSVESYSTKAFWMGFEPPFRKEIPSRDVLIYRVPHLSYERRPGTPSVKLQLEE